MGFRTPTINELRISYGYRSVLPAYLSFSLLDSRLMPRTTLAYFCTSHILCTAQRSGNISVMIGLEHHVRLILQESCSSLDAPRGLENGSIVRDVAHRVIVHASIRDSLWARLICFLRSKDAPVYLALPGSPDSLGNVRNHIQPEGLTKSERI